MTGWRLVQQRQRELREAARVVVEPDLEGIGDVAAWVVVAMGIAVIAGLALG